MQQQEKEEEEREEEEGWRSSRKRRRSSERRHHVHPSLSGSAAPWRRQHRPHCIPQIQRMFSFASLSMKPDRKFLHSSGKALKLEEKLSSHGVLLQGYKNSPTKFGEQLAKDLESWEPPPGEGQLLQYVDDLLRATRTQETCVDWTKQGIALGILAQNLGPYQRAVACLSKQLDTAAKGWPSGSTGEPVIHECLETIEATYSSRQDLKDTLPEDAETCLLMEADPDPECCDKCLSKCLEFRLKIEGCVIRGYDIDFNITQGCTDFHENQTKITPPVLRKAVITQIPTIPEVEEQVTPVVSKIKP
ncbi:hypothetical protein DUI87_30874 [Hirundo rustica rustica]|uniref:Uncharacterized protein n=1 Tax=Hirundo rustica rustica TaxID=333673 RepID=A0A3M0IW92_HIRRU|nr:hypothetical protein DUI87_30874 [Hirundo rustica rustica]